jgi:alkylated DNA repair dioxygenase AlkB
MSDSEDFLMNIPEANVFVEVFRNAIPEELRDRLRVLGETECTVRYPNYFMNRYYYQPRMNVCYGDDGMTQMDYSRTAIPIRPWTPETRELRDLLKSDVFNPNSCLVNGYVEKTHSVAKHRDKDLMDELECVATISIGGSRRFVFSRYKGVIPRNKIPTVELPERVETYLHDGDVLFMYGLTNLYYEHEVPVLRKCDGIPFAPRYSYTLREIRNGTKPVFLTTEELEAHDLRKR